MFTVFQLLQILIGFLMWTLIGQGALALLIWPSRHQNVIYRIFQGITWPVWKFARLITPRFVRDVYVGWVALFLLFGVRLGLYMLFYSQGWIPTVVVPPKS